MLFAIEFVDGSVGVMRVVDEQASAEGEIAKWSRRDRSRVAGCRAIDESALPADRTFRNAWISDGKAIVHDMEKCRAIHRDRMRAARAPKLAALDIEYQRADEAGDAEAKKRIAARKQALRDVPMDPRIDAATTPDALNATWPAILA